MNDIIIKSKKIFLIFLFSFLNIFNYLNAEIYEEIKVEGSNRLSVETVIMFSGLKLGVDLNQNDLNSSIKKLYKTNYFKNIEIITNDKILKIKIIENPIIQSVRINGVKNKRILKKLREITKKSEKYPFLKNDIIDQNNLLLNIIRATGFFFAELDTKIIDNQNNSVDIIYNFELGEL